MTERRTIPVTPGEPVDTIPEVVKGPQGGAHNTRSKWDPVVEQVRRLDPGQYLPVEVPSSQSIKWLHRRYPGLNTARRGKFLYLWFGDTDERHT